MRRWSSPEPSANWTDGLLAAARPAVFMFGAVDILREKAGNCANCFAGLVWHRGGRWLRYGLQGSCKNAPARLSGKGTCCSTCWDAFCWVVSRNTRSPTFISPGLAHQDQVGFFGAQFTTFSTFSYEMARMLEDGEWTRAWVYVARRASLAGLSRYSAGMRIADRI